MMMAFTISLSALPSLAENEPSLWWQQVCAQADEDNDKGNYADAAKKLESVVQKLGQTDRDCIESVQALADLCYTYSCLNRRTDAERCGKRAIEIAELNPPHSPLLNKLGYTPAQIVSGQKKMLRLALEALANSYLSEERYSEAEKLLKESTTKLGVGDDSVVSQALLAEVLKQKSEYSKAAEAFKRVIAIREKLKFPEETAKAYECLGNCYYLQNDLSSAESAFKKAIVIMQRAKLTTRPAMSDMYDDLGNVYYYQKRYPEAESQYRLSLAALHDAGGMSDERTGERLRDLGSVLVILDKLDEAELCYNTAYKDKKYVASKEIFLDNLFTIQRKTSILTYKRFFTASATDMHQCIVSNQKKIQPDSLAWAKFLEDVCVSFPQFAVRTDPVIPLLKHAIAIRTRLEGANSPFIAHDQYLIAYRLASIGGEFSGPALKSYAMWKALSKSDSAKLKYWQFAQIRLAYLLGALGKEHRTEAMEMADIAYDTESKSGIDLFDLATLYELFGKFGKARVIYDEAFEIAKARNNKANMAVAAFARASVSFRENDFVNAWSEAKQAESLFKETQGDEYYKQSALNLSCLKLLTDLSVQRGNLSEAESYARQLTSPLKFQPSNMQVQRDYLELAKILLLENKNDEAKKIVNNAIAVLSNSTYGQYLGEIELAHAHDMLGSIQMSSRHYAEADLEFRQAYNLYRDDDESTAGILGMVNDLNQMARCFSVSGGQADQTVQLACLKLDSYLKSAFPQLSFAQQCAFVSCVGDQIDPLLTYSMTRETARGTFTFLMRWQGLLVDAVRRSSGDASGDSETSNQLRKIRNQLSQISAQGGGSSTVTSLTNEKEALERKLAFGRKSDDSADEVLNQTSKDFAAALADDEAFVDIVHYHRFDDDTPAYAALVVTKNGGVKLLNLPNAEQIDATVSKWLQSMAAPGGSVRDISLDSSNDASATTEDPDVLCAKVASQLWAPLKAVIPVSTKKIWLCPDAKLSTLPWSVLLENAHADNLMLSQIDSPRAFLTLKGGASKVASSGDNKVLLVGGINFANKSLFLPGTKQEVTEIEGLAKDKGYQLDELTGDAATKSSLLEKLSKSAYAHIATHGFFNDASSRAASAEKSTSGAARNPSDNSAFKSVSREVVSVSTGESSDNTYLMERDPLLSSGLLLAPTKSSGKTDTNLSANFDTNLAAKSGASVSNKYGVSVTNKSGANVSTKFGANASAISDTTGGVDNTRSGDAVDISTDNNADDRLTAEELVGQDLSGLRTVVLSACNSGRGKGYDGQGVMGLRAALVGAGAKGVVMSLWPVDDDATRELMKQFYANLWNKTNPMSPVLALRAAQQAVRNNPNGKWKHPFYWSGWIYDGLGW